MHLLLEIIHIIQYNVAVLQVDYRFLEVIKMKNKHLTFEERIVIEEQLNKGVSVHKIAKRLDRSDSSVVREIKRNRYLFHTAQKESCEYKYSRACPAEKLCNGAQKCFRIRCNDCDEYCNAQHCYSYTPYICPMLRKSPFVCNGCSENPCRQGAHSPKFKYNARRAQIVYEDKLKESREGITLSSEEMEKLDNLVSPLLLQGQSLKNIINNHKEEIPVSESSLYQYVDRCYFTARNLDMPRKVRFKPRYKHDKRAKSLQEFAVGRTYKDFQEFIEKYPDVNIWELDTVIGINGGYSLLTMLHRKSTFMIAVLLKEHTQEAVIEALNDICEVIGIEEFQRLFQVILTDRGTEFGNPLAIECDRYGEIKTKLFYCDPYCSWQKGMLERNHEYIRQVLPKGRSFNDLSQSDIHLLMNHINNYPRASLNSVSPYDLAKLMLGDNFLKAMKSERILPDDLILKPYLMRKPFDNK